MQRRIFGLENEYGIVFLRNGRRQLGPDEIARHLFRKIKRSNATSDSFRENGARLYLDVGNHPEYATPECDSIEDLVAHDKAGERVLQQLAGETEERLHAEGTLGTIYLFKNNTDWTGNSFGCHENYLIDRRCEFTRYTDALMPFFVSRQIYAGAGKVLQTRAGWGFHMSQSAAHMVQDVSSSSTRSRPIINLKDEPHADPARYRRLHIIVGDSNMSEYATFLKTGTTALVLRMIEDKYPIREMLFEDPTYGPAGALRAIGADLTCRRPTMRLDSGISLSAFDVQSVYLNAALGYADTHDMTPEEKRALGMWQHVMTAIESDPLQLDRECDWVIKYKLIEAFRERHRLPIGGARVHLFDLSYHDINRKRGLYYLTQDKGLVERITTDQAIDEAIVEAPPTRARLRKQYIEAARKARLDFNGGWEQFKTANATAQVKCKDPFNSVDPRVDKAIAKLAEIGARNRWGGPGGRTTVTVESALEPTLEPTLELSGL